MDRETGPCQLTHVGMGALAQDDLAADLDNVAGMDIPHKSNEADPFNLDAFFRTL
jgi:hypothetical protein